MKTKEDCLREAPSLKMGMDMWAKVVCEEKDKEIDYWGLRCEAAEALILFPRVWQSSKHQEAFAKWQSLKQQKP